MYPNDLSYREIANKLQDLNCELLEENLKLKQIINNPNIQEITKQYLNSKSILENIIDNIWDLALKHQLVCGKFDSFDLDESEINIRWSDRWQYGGYEDGVKSFPIELLWTDYNLYFENLANKKLQEEKERKELAELRQKEKDLKLLQELSEKYNQYGRNKD